MSLFKFIIDAPKIFVEVPKTYFFGNFTYFSQAPASLFTLIDGGCSAVDACFCINPAAKPLFISGAVANIGSGICMGVAFGCGCICVPAIVSLGIAGTALRRIGQYTVTMANSMEPKPTFSKGASVVTRFM